MEHLSLEIFDLSGKGSKYAMLPENTSITITDTSEIFASGDVWSYSFTLNVNANAHIFGTAGDLHGSRLHAQFHKRKARLWVEGLPLYLGYLKLGDEADVDENGNVDVTFESGQKTFDEMIEGAKANQVPMIGDVPIGMALWRKRWTGFKVKLTAELTIAVGNIPFPMSGTVKHDNGQEWFEFESDGEVDGASVQEYPRMVYPKGHFYSTEQGVPDWDKNYLNTDNPYSEDEDGTPVHPFCNVALCYQKYGYEKKDKDGNTTVDYSEDPEAQRGYEYMPANRVNSAPNFFVIYWIRALMTHLGIYIEENQMMDVEDLRRLFFVNTNCEYIEPKKLRTVPYNERFGRYHGYSGLTPEYINSEKNIDKEESGFKGVNVQYDPSIGGVNLAVHVSDIAQWDNTMKERYKSNNNYYHKAFASSECFPNAGISEVISAIEKGFGVRFLFSDNYQRVRIILLRNVFRNEETQKIVCVITGEQKTENCIKGFRMTYGDNKENTEFFYKGFDDKLPKKNPYFIDDSDKHDYSHWDLNAEYANIINNISAFDKTCYVTPNTGNSYGIKIDKDAKRYDLLYPSLFEFAGYMDAEDGDCTGEEETIETVEVGFMPAIMNDLNMEEERSPNNSREQRFALFVDETMRPRRPDLNDGQDYNDPTAYYDVNGKLYKKWDGYVYQNMMSGDSIVMPGVFAIRSDMYAAYTTCTAKLKGDKYFIEREVDASFDLKGHIYEGYHLYLQDNYEPNDDGICPIEKHDWGLTLGIMRGSGRDAHVDYSADIDDGEGNDAWDIVPGDGATQHPDTCDNYGNLWHYVGTVTIDTAQKAVNALDTLYPSSNAPFYTNDKGYVVSAAICQIRTIDSKESCAVLLVSGYSLSGRLYNNNELSEYVNYLDGHSVEELFALDAVGYNGIRNILVEVNSSKEKRSTFLQLCKKAYGGSEDVIVIDDGVGSLYGRFSLKLRAEKLNPYFDTKQQEMVVRTKAEAAEAMQVIYTTSDTDLLNRPKVSNATMRAAGWDAPGDGYATVYSIGYGVQYSNGEIHEILWTPIKEDGTVLTQAQLQTYINGFNDHSREYIIANDTLHLILDIDTTEQRAEDLHKLQAIYYAEEGEVVESVTINPRYLEIEDKNLRGRGLCDQFYKEYSYWVRNARICKMTVRMELAQLLAIDKTKKVTVGDITGFIRKMQYSVSNKTGLGIVTMEIMYI